MANSKTRFLLGFSDLRFSGGGIAYPSARVVATRRRLTPEEIVRVESAPPRIAIIVGDKRGGRSMASTAARSKHVDNADVETLLPRTSHASHEIELSEVIHGQHEIEEVVEAQPVLVASRTPLEILRTCYNRHPSLRLGFLGLTVAVLCLFVIWTFKHSSDVSSPNTNVSYPEIAKIQASDGRPGDQFGWSFGVDGEYMIVGSPWTQYVTRLWAKPTSSSALMMSGARKHI